MSADAPPPIAVAVDEWLRDVWNGLERLRKQSPLSADNAPLRNEERNVCSHLSSDTQSGCLSVSVSARHHGAALSGLLKGGLRHIFTYKA